MEGRSNPKFLAARLSPPWLAPVSLLPFSHPWHPDFPAPRCSPHALVLLPSLAAPSAHPCPPAELVPASGGGCVRGSLGGGRGAQLSAFVASALATESQSTVSPAPPTVMPVVASGPFVALGLLGGRGGGGGSPGWPPRGSRGEGCSAPARSVQPSPALQRWGVPSLGGPVVTPVSCALRSLGELQEDGGRCSAPITSLSWSSSPPPEPALFLGAAARRFSSSLAPMSGVAIPGVPRVSPASLGTHMPAVRLGA